MGAGIPLSDDTFGAFDRAPPGVNSERFVEKTHEVHALIHEAQTLLERMKLEQQTFFEEFPGALKALVQKIGRLMEDDEIVHVAIIVFDPQLMFNELIQFIEIDIREKLARQVADGQPAIRRVTPQALVFGHTLKCRALRLQKAIGARIVKKHLCRQIQQPGFDDFARQNVKQRRFVNADEKIPDVGPEIVRWPLPIPRDRTKPGRQAMGGVQGAATGNARERIADEARIKPGCQPIVNHVVDDTISKRRRPDLPDLRLFDDEGDASADLVSSLQQFLIKLKQVLFEAEFEIEGVNRISLSFAAIEIGPDDFLKTQFHREPV